MPQQLIYTSAPRGLVAGRSGHCTVARSATMREALMLQLEKLSYYQHLSLSGGQERRIYSSRVVDIRGARYHVLSRIQDAGLDFTGRTNFLAHHLVFTPEEVRQFCSPPIILRGWTGWETSWQKEPKLLENEDWSGLACLSAKASIPAISWQQLTGDAVNGYGLLESRPGISFRVDNVAEEQILALFAESLELFELRDPRRDFRASAWQYTFTTSMQEQDNPADFRWRCLHSDNPASNRFVGPDYRPLSELRAARVTGEEEILARSGRQPPRFVVQPQNVRGTEGETARLRGKAEGVPAPKYQWFAVDRAGNGQIIAKGTDAELVLQNPPVGQSRYVVRASNSMGDVTSDVAILSVEQKLRLSQPHPVSEPRELAKPTLPAYAKSAEDIAHQRRRIEAEKAQIQFQKGFRRKKVLAVSGVIVGLAVLGGLFLWKYRRPNIYSNGTKPTNSVPSADILVSNPPQQEISTIQATKSLPDATATNNGPQENQQIRPIESRPSDKFPLPTGWAESHVGSVLDSRAEPLNEKSPLHFELTAAASGFRTNGDNLLFVCKTNPGKEFKATLFRVSRDSPQRLAGIMLRESQKSDSGFLFVGASPQKVLAYRRDSKGVFLSREAEIPKGLESKPLILKFDQVKGESTATYSFDSTHWFPFTNFLISAKAQTLVGFALSSGNSAERVTAHFIEVSPIKQQ
jgi:hypothetical protein